MVNPKVDLKNVQGDVFHRGFPKYVEVYYFFTILQESKFCKNLAKLDQIPSLYDIIELWRDIDAARAETPKRVIETANALIAFSSIGLQQIQKGLKNLNSPTKLQLKNVKSTDPAFFNGMSNDQELNDETAAWDPLFLPPPDPNTDSLIHGILKVAGNSKELVNKKLNDIKTALGHGSVISDVQKQSPPSTVDSLVEGNVRDMDKGFKGREHFGFLDGVSQPLMDGIGCGPFEKDNAPFMNTPSDLIIISDGEPVTNRPAWMNDGSFLVFRKLQQDVGTFLDLVKNNYASFCKTPDQFASKLMGRWHSGRSLLRHPDSDQVTDPQFGVLPGIPSSNMQAFLDGENEYHFEQGRPNDPRDSTLPWPYLCPLASHTRKMNTRDGTETSRRARIVRNGIPYGSEFGSFPLDRLRGLLFACYQSDIKLGFQTMQISWADNSFFPPVSRGVEAGHDPIVGHAKTGSTKRQPLFFDEKDVPLQNKIDPFPELVTVKGGEYFFVPSLSTLTKVFGSPE